MSRTSTRPTPAATTAPASTATDVGLLVVRSPSGSPGTPLAVLAGVTELAGGLAVAVGLLAPLASAGIAATMVGATAVTWAGSGTYFKAAGGVEYELLLVAVALGLALTGAGRFSLDHGRPWSSERFRYLAAALGLALGLLALLVRIA